MKKEKKQNRIFYSEALRSLRESDGDHLWAELLADWKWIMRYVRRHRKSVTGYTVLGLVSTSMSLLLSYVIKQLINVVVAGQYQAVPFLGVLLVCGLILNPAAGAAALRLSAAITIDVNNDIQAEVFEKVLDANWAEIRQRPVGDLINRLNSDVKTVSSNAVKWIPNLVINVYTFALTFVLLWRIDYVMALISLLSAPFLLLASRFLLGKLRSRRKAVNELDSDMISFETEAFSNFDMIKSFGISNFFSGRLSDWHVKARKKNLDYNAVQLKAEIFMALTSGLVTLVSLGYSLLRLAQGMLLFGDMTFFLTQRSNVSSRFQSIVSAAPGMLNSSVSAHRLRELTEVSTEPCDESAFQELSKAVSGGVSVILDHVSFSYDGVEEIYSGGSFAAHPSEIVTILGPSGEGKTTLLRLILGLITPDTGEVSLLTAQGEKLPVSADARKLIAYVPQGASVVSGTVADNMRMVKEDATDEEIISALKAACAWEFVEKLPDGIYARLGEKTQGLSAGQAQRIAIARALLRNSPILILDEATSALDAETERLVLKNILEMAPEKTCIVSTHRPSILAQSDRIYRVEDKQLTDVTVEEAIRMDYLREDYQ